jgi:hypothetical protein
MLLMRLTLKLFLALKKDVSIESPSAILLSMDNRMHFLHWRYIFTFRYSIVGLPVFAGKTCTSCFIALVIDQFSEQDVLQPDYGSMLVVTSECFSSCQSANGNSC